MGIFAHIDAGKTTFTEQLLHISGELAAPGTIEEGNTESDTLPEEIRRGISIQTSILQFQYPKKSPRLRVNLLDTPGHIDFYSQTESALEAVDIGVLLLDASRGIQVQTEKIFHLLSKKKIPILFFINKSDRYSPFETSNKLQEWIGIKKAIPMFKNSNGVNVSLFWNHEPESINLGDEDSYFPFFENNFDLTNEYFKNPEKVTTIALKGARLGFAGVEIYPIFAGSALTAVSIPEVLQFLMGTSIKIQGKEEYFPIKKKVGSGRERMVAVKFRDSKQKSDKISLFGSDEFMDIGSSLEFQKDHKVRMVLPGEILWFQMPRTEILARPLGDVGEGKRFLNQFSIVIEPNTSTELVKIREALDDLLWEDEGLVLDFVHETGHYQLSGRGELHLDVSLRRLEQISGIQIQAGGIRVARFELIKNMAISRQFEHNTDSGSIQSGRFQVLLEESNDFSNSVEFDESFPKALREFIMSGIGEIMSHGPNGEPIIGVRMRFSSYTEPLEKDKTSLVNTKVAVISGLKSLIQGNTILIGPKSVLSIIIPEVYIGVVSGEIHRLGGRITEVENQGDGISVVRAEAGAQNMLGFTGTLRNMTKGRGELSLETFFSPDKYTVIN